MKTWKEFIVFCIVIVTSITLFHVYQDNFFGALLNLKEGKSYQEVETVLSSWRYREKQKDKDIPYLFIAALNNDIRVAKHLINGGADINHINKKGLTPLSTAIVNKHYKMIDLLLDAGSNPNLKVYNENIHLPLAIISGDITIVKKLINKGSIVNTTALSISFCLHNEELALLLINTKNTLYDPSVILFVACLSDCLEATKKLYNKIHKIDDEYLISAIILHRKSILKFLLNHTTSNINKGAKNTSTTPLKALITSKELIEIFKEEFFIKYNLGAKKHKISIENNSMRETVSKNLFTKSPYSTKEIFELLLLQGVDIHLKDENGDTPLINAVIFNNKEMVELLLQYGANPYTNNDNGETASFIAEDEGLIEIQEILEKYKI